MRNKWIMLILCACVGTMAVHAADSADKTSVFDAAMGGDLTTVSNFVAGGGDVNMQDDLRLRRYTLLMCAVEGQSVAVCEFLLSEGARVDIQSKAGFTVESMAKLRYELTLPKHYEDRIASARRRLTEVKEEKYREATEKRLKFYEEQYEEADTSKEAQERAKAIVAMIEKASTS